MSDIAPTQLGAILSALEEQLRARDTREHLVVIGGSGLVAMGLANRATQDVDVLGRVRDGRIETAQPLPDPVVDAATAVGRDFQLIDGWLNAGPASLVTTGSGLPEGFESRAQTVDYGPGLTITFAGRRDQVFFKLYALADRGYARDERDLRGLDPSEEELRAASAWIFSQNAPGPFDEQVERTLARFGVTGAHRVE